MENLLIIGNGFDLAHGLETRYTDFIKSIVEACIKDRMNPKNLIKIKNYSINNYHEFIGAVRGDSRYAPYMVSYPNYTSLMMTTLLKDVALQDWCDIEHKYFELLSSVSGRQSTYSSAKRLNDDFELIKKKLEEYLITQKSNNAIEGYKEIFNCLILGNSLLLNFNYTNTIKQLYETEIRKRDVIHIHGE